jgi:hypothetical protein
MKAQVWSMDFAISFTMFFLAVILIIFAWDYTVSQNYSEVIFSEIENTALSVSDVLIRTQGFPTDWTPETVETIGLVSKENVINETKIANLINLSKYYADYNFTKTMLGIGNHEFYLEIKDLYNQTMKANGDDITIGVEPYQNAEIVIPMERYVIYKNEIAKLRFILWT